MKKIYYRFLVPAMIFGLFTISCGASEALSTPRRVEVSGGGTLPESGSCLYVFNAGQSNTMVTAFFPDGVMLTAETDLNAHNFSSVERAPGLDGICPSVDALAVEAFGPNGQAKISRYTCFEANPNNPHSQRCRQNGSGKETK